MAAVAYAELTLRSGKTYRKSTYIQWGTSKRSIGSCLLLNPGAAKFEPTSKLYKQLVVDGTAQGEVQKDPTMEQLVKFVERVYGSSDLDGRFHIYNLFTLQNARVGNALSQLKELVETGEYNPESSLPALRDLVQHPWILLGWGCDEPSFPDGLIEVKKKWLGLISQAGTVQFGKKHPRSRGYYHPCPLIPTQRPKILEDLVVIYQNTMSTAKANTHCRSHSLAQRDWPKQEGIT